MGTGNHKTTRIWEVEKALGSRDWVPKAAAVVSRLGREVARLRRETIRCKDNTRMGDLMCRIFLKQELLSEVGTVLGS